MSRVYANFVCNLTSDMPSVDEIEPVLGCLRKDLRRELRRRGLLEAPPTFLGYVDGSWHVPDTMTELVVDCYTFIFVRRLPGLRDQAAMGRDIGGLVRRNIRFFLTDLQRRNDPVGYRYYQLLHRCLTAAVKAGAIYVVAGEREIRNTTVLALDPAADPSGRSRDLAELASGWNDQLLPGLIVNRGGAVQNVEQQLSRLIGTLRDGGVTVFFFKDLVDALKIDARRRWAAIWSGSACELALAGTHEQPELVPVVPPFEPTDRLGDLHACVGRSIEGLPERQKTKEYLWRLWLLLRGIALGEMSAPEVPDNRHRPSDLQLSKHLSIPRGRLPGLFEILGRLVNACRSGGTAPEQTGAMTGRKDHDSADDGNSKRNVAEAAAGDCRGGCRPGARAGSD